MTLFISDEMVPALKNILAQLCFALFCALFGAIYECFSHEVYSYYMIYAFAIPLVLAVLPLLVIVVRGKGIPHRAFLKLWNYGTITLTVGCLLKGILDIYGTTNRLLFIYPVVSMTLYGIAVLLVLPFKTKRTSAERDAGNMYTDDQVTNTLIPNHEIEMKEMV